MDSVATLLDSLSNADFNNLGQFLEDLTSAVDVTSAITTITDSLGVYSNLESALRYAVTSYKIMQALPIEQVHIFILELFYPTWVWRMVTPTSWVVTVLLQNCSLKLSSQPWMLRLVQHSPIPSQHTSNVDITPQYCVTLLFADFSDTFLSSVSSSSDFRTFASDLVDEDIDAAPVVLARFSDPTVVQVP